MNRILKKVAICKLGDTLTLLKAALELILMVIYVAFPQPEVLIMKQVERLSSWIKSTHGLVPSEFEIEKEVQVLNLYNNLCVYFSIDYIGLVCHV